jgi:hypothetical protein
MLIKINRLNQYVYRLPSAFVVELKFTFSFKTSNFLLFLGHKCLKGTATICITLIVGVVTNVFSNLSGWKQALIAILLCVLVFFIHWRRVTQFVLSLPNIIRQVCHWLFNEGFMYLHILINATIRRFLRNTANPADSSGVVSDIIETRF